MSDSQIPSIFTAGNPSSLIQRSTVAQERPKKLQIFFFPVRILDPILSFTNAGDLRRLYCGEILLPARSNHLLPSKKVPYGSPVIGLRPRFPSSTPGFGSTGRGSTITPPQHSGSAMAAA